MIIFAYQLRGSFWWSSNCISILIFLYYPKGRSRKPLCLISTADVIIRSDDFEKCNITLLEYSPGKYMLVEYTWNIPIIYSRNIRKKFPMKFWEIFPITVPGILIIGIFPTCSMNMLRTLHASFWVDQEIQ